MIMSIVTQVIGYNVCLSTSWYWILPVKSILWYLTLGWLAISRCYKTPCFVRQQLIAHVCNQSVDYKLLFQANYLPTPVCVQTRCVCRRLCHVCPCLETSVYALARTTGHCLVHGSQPQNAGLKPKVILKENRLIIHSLKQSERHQWMPIVVRSL